VDPSGHFTDVIRRATAKLPAQRYANAREMHDALIAAWKRSQPPAGDGDATHHGTVAFLLKRIEHRGDFPAISRSLAEINKMTSSEETASIARIAGVVLRDYALTNRLLKLANSTYYSRPLGKVSTVSDAIRILGFDQVRLTCIGLTCFGSFAGGGKSLRLREQSIASFIAGLVARHLAAEMNIKDTEEAFLCAMLFDLGKTLALYYFPEDFREIEGLVCRGAALEQATRSVLGITLPELGHAVGEIWGLPPIVLDCMSNNPAPDAPAAVNRMHCIVRFANALVSVDPDHMSSVEDIAASAACLRPELTLGTAQICALLNAAIEKFKTFASVLEVDPAKSSYIQRLERWVAIVGERLNAASDRSAEAPRTILPTESPPDT
jgi:HD-like signal output (HDOD) protein